MKRNFIIILLGVVVGAVGLVWALKKKESEFKKTDSGILYKIEQQGKGTRTPQTGELVQVHYTGWLDVDGKEGASFDSSVKRGTPFAFNVGLGHVIKGWDETLKDMKEGEIRYIILPGQLAYGPQSVGTIPANSTLRFRVELLKIGQ